MGLGLIEFLNLKRKKKLKNRKKLRKWSKLICFMLWMMNGRKHEIF